MAKKSDVTLLEPPRYARNDPRNQRRVNAGHLLSMKLGGYDYPIRRLRRVGDNYCVTLPLQVRASLELKCGDWLRFGKGPWPGCAWMCKVTEWQYQRLLEGKGGEFRRKARKVRRSKSSLFVTIAKTVRKILSAEVGDSLIFGPELDQGVTSVSVIKGGGVGTGSRRRI